MARHPSASLRLALLLLAPAVVLAAGQQPQQQQAPPPDAPQLPRPSYTTEVSLVTADVTVVDRNGAQVTGLTEADFSVKVDGAPRQIATVQFVDLRQPVAAEAKKEEKAPLVSSNQSVGTGRLIAFVIDQANIRPGRGKAVLRAAERLLSQLTPADRVAVFAVPGPGIRVSFTNDFALVREGLARISGAGGPIEGNRFNLGLGEAFESTAAIGTFQEVAARECGTGPTCPDEVESDARTMVIEAHSRTSLSIAGIEAAISELVPIPGPKTVLLVSEGLPADRPTDDLFSVGGLAARARASVYVLRLNTAAFEAAEQRLSYTSVADAQIQTEGLETLAGLARGTVFNVVGAGTGVFDRVAREIAGYYLISFEPTETDRDGKAHQIKVEVKGTGLTVRSRREFTVRTAAARGTKASDQELLGGALGSPVLLTDVPLRVTTYNFGDRASDKVRLLVAAEVGEPRTGAAELGLGFVLFDLRGRAVDSGLLRTTLLPRDPGTPSPLVYVGSVPIDPGDYLLKFAAVDDEGRIGTVERRVHARLVPAGDLRLSDIVVGPRRAARTVQPAHRSAGGPGTAVALVELYASRDERLDRARVTIEVAEAADGPALVSSPAQVAGRHAAPAAGARGPRFLGAAARPLRGARARRGRRQDGRHRDAAAGRRVLAPPARAPAASGGAPAGAPGPRFEPATLVETFSRDPLFEPDVVGEFLDEVTFAAARDVSPALEEAIRDAREGRLADAAEKARSDRLHPLATFVRGLAALQQGQLDAAAGFFRATLQAAPGAYTPMAYFAACYAAGGRDDEAAGAWQTSLLGLDDSPLVFQMLVDAAMRAGDAQTAMGALQEAMNKWPEDARFTQRLGVALLLFGRPKDALVALDRHLAAHPDDQRALFLAVQAIYGVNAAGRRLDTPDGDLARARRTRPLYVRLGGAQQALVPALARVSREARRRSAECARLLEDMNLVVIALGGAVGALARYGLSGAVHRFASPYFPGAPSSSTSPGASSSGSSPA